MNSRVIYGDDESFPGKGKGEGKGKLKRNGADREDELLTYGDRDGRAKSAKSEKKARKGGKGRD